jgi:hypothetical protein
MYVKRRCCAVALDVDGTMEIIMNNILFKILPQIETPPGR